MANKLKREQKRKRKRALCRQEALSRQKQEKYEISFPEFFFQEADNADGDLAGIVREFFRTHKFNNKKLFSPEEMLFFKDMKKHGFFETISELQEKAYGRAMIERTLPPELPELSSQVFEDFKIDLLTQHLIMRWGGLLFMYLQRHKYFDKFFPRHDVAVMPRKCDFLVQIKALARKRTKYGNRLVSDGVKIQHNDKEYYLGFSEHSINRLSERVVVDPLSYASYADFWEIIYGNRDIKLKVLPNYDGNMGDTIWVEVFVRISNNHFPLIICESILEKDCDAPWYKPGYLVCAAPEDDSGVISVKTFLTQGMRGTPEDKFLSENKLEHSEYKRIRQSLEDTKTYLKAVETKNFYAWQFFHSHGIIQAIEK